MNATKKAHFFAGANAVAIVLIAGSIVAMLNYLSVRHYRKFDLTKENDHALSEKTLQVLRDLKETVTVSAVIADQELANPEVKEQIVTLLDNYKSHTDKLKVEFVNPDTDEVKLKELGVTSLNTLVFKGLSGRQLVNINTLTESQDGGMSFGGEQTLKAFKGEEAFTNALASLSEPPRAVCFTEGHGELELKGREAGGLAVLDALISGENYATQALSTRGPDPIPAACAVVVVAGMEIPFAPEEVAKFDAYLKNKGRLLLMAEPLAGQTRDFLTTGFEPLLKTRGLELQRDLVFDPKNQLRANSQEPMIAAGLAGQHVIIAPFRSLRVPVVFPISRSLGLPAPIEGAAAQWQPLLATSPESFGVTSLKGMETGSVEHTPSDLPGPLALAAAYGGSDEAGERLVVTGSARFTSNLFAQDTANPHLIVNAIHWLASRPARIAIPAKKIQTVNLAMTHRQIMAAMLWLVVGAPGLVVVGGLLLFLKRRRG